MTSGRGHAPAKTTPAAPLLVAWGIVAVASVTTVFLSLRHQLYSDELEHVHAGWLVSSGQRPFTDFFEHHHPLFWHALATLLPSTTQSAATLVTLRLLMLVPFGGIAVLCFRLAAWGSGGRHAPWFATALLLSMSEFVRVAYQIRPDVPATLCALGAVLVLLHGLRKGSRALAAVAGVLMGVAFLLSLKALLAIAVTLALLGLGCRRGAVHWSQLAAFLGGSAGPALVYGAYLWGSGSLHDYYVANWVLNADKTAGMERVRPLQLPVFVNAGFWLAAVLGVFYTGCRRTAAAGARWSAHVGAGVLCLLVLTGRTESRSVILAIPFLAVAAGAALADLLRRARFSPAGAALLLAALCAAPLAEMGRSLGEDNLQQLAMIDFVLARTPPGEPVYDANGAFNVFRPDLHYFWFFMGPGRNMPLEAEVGRAQRAYLLSRLRRGPYDPCALVARARPRIVSTHRIDLAACGLSAAYRPTRYPGLFERRDRDPGPADEANEKPVTTGPPGP